MRWGWWGRGGGLGVLDVDDHPLGTGSRDCGQEEGKVRDVSIHEYGETTIFQKTEDEKPARI